MLMYALIGLSFVLVGITGLQFTYMFYLDRVYKERRKYLHTLEQKCSVLNAKLKDAERRIDEQDRLISALGEKIRDDEIWADVIGDS